MNDLALSAIVLLVLPFVLGAIVMLLAVLFGALRKWLAGMMR